MSSSAAAEASSAQEANISEILDDLLLDPAAGASDKPSAAPLGKDCLVDPTSEQYERLKSFVLATLKESARECTFIVGRGEDGTEGLSEEQLKASVVNLEKLAADCHAGLCHLLDQDVKDGGKIGHYMLREICEEDDFIETRIAVVGNVDAGKSTLLGVLTHGQLDNGRGRSRLQIFRHRHEAESGRTSSISHDILGFSATGEIVNRPAHDGSLDWPEVCTKASKVITFIDLAGHEKYLKTTVFGLTGHSPHFAMLMIGSNMGVVGMTKEHLGLSLALNVPVFVVVTKIDMCPENVLKDTITLLQKILKSPGCKKIPMLVGSKADVLTAAQNFVSERLCPIFQVSNVTGENLDLLKMFLNMINVPLPGDPSAPVDFQIDEVYSVPGAGTVVSGTTISGTIKPNDTLMLGPDSLGQFTPVQIKSIHRRRMATDEVKAGQTGSLALKKIKRAAIRKGMVLLDSKSQPKAVWEFDAEILVLHHPTTIGAKYQAMVHCGSVRQTAAIISMDKEHIRTGDKTIARLKFIRSPEYLRVGAKLVFREGRTKAIGTVVGLGE